MSGTRDLFHSRRTYYAECEYWIRDERQSVGPASEWILKNSSSGVFYAKEVSPRHNQMNQVGNVFAFDRNNIALETDDDVNEIDRGCIVKYNNEIWIVDSVQREIHRKESEFNVELDYKYTINLRK